MLTTLTEILLALLSWATFAPLAFQFSMGCCCEEVCDCVDSSFSDAFDSMSSCYTHNTAIGGNPPNTWTASGGNAVAPHDSNHAQVYLQRDYCIQDLSASVLTLETTVSSVGDYRAGLIFLSASSIIYPYLYLDVLNNKIFYWPGNPALGSSQALTPADGDVLKIVITFASGSVDFYVNGSLKAAYSSIDLSGHSSGSIQFGLLAQNTSSDTATFASLDLTVA